MFLDSSVEPLIQKSRNCLQGHSRIDILIVPPDAVH